MKRGRDREIEREIDVREKGIEGKQERERGCDGVERGREREMELERGEREDDLLH